MNDYCSLNHSIATSTFFSTLSLFLSVSGNYISLLHPSEGCDQANLFLCLFLALTVISRKISPIFMKFGRDV